MFEKVLELGKERLKGYLPYILVLVLILLVISFARNISRIRNANKKIEEAEEKVSKLISENAELRKQVEVVKSEEFVESQLRDKLGLAKEGEIVVVLPEEEILRKLAPKHVEEEEILPDPNWKKWLKLFY